MISKMTPLSTAGFYSHRKTHLPQKSNKEESEVNPVAHLGLNERKRYFLRSKDINNCSFLLLFVVYISWVSILGGTGHTTFWTQSQGVIPI